MGAEFRDLELERTDDAAPVVRRLREVQGSFNQQELADAVAEASCQHMVRQEDKDLLETVRERLRMVRSRNNIAAQRRARERDEDRIQAKLQSASKKNPETKPPPDPEIENKHA